MLQDIHEHFSLIKDQEVYIEHIFSIGEIPDNRGKMPYVQLTITMGDEYASLSILSCQTVCENISKPGRNA